MALQNSGKGMLWYNNELVDMAKEIGYRLLPAFNTSTGIPYPRVSYIPIIIQSNLCPRDSVITIQKT